MATHTPAGLAPAENDSDVIVTPLGSCSDMASPARNDDPTEPRLPALAGVLANQAIVELYRLPGPISTELKLHVAAQVARDGGWKGYRNGRQRLAGWVGIYAECLAPTGGWRFVPVDQMGQTWVSWTDEDTWFADVVAPGSLGELDIYSLAAVAAELLDGHDLDAVRVLTLNAPLASRVFTAGGPARGVALAESALNLSAVA